MSDSEEDVVAVDIDDDDQSDGNNSDEEAVVEVVAEAVEADSEDDDEEEEGTAVEVEVEEPDDEEEEETVAQVVEEDDEEENVAEVAEEENDAQVVEMEDENAVVVEAEAVAVAVEEEEEEEVDEEPPAKRSKTNAGKSKARTAPKKKAAPAKSPAKKSPASKKKKSPAAKKSTTPKKAKKGSGSKSKSSSSKNDVHFARIDSRRMGAANNARELLYETVQKMPFPVATHQGDTFSVRSFGQLKMPSKSSSGSGDTNNFCTSTSLYPVGFSCDRIEFSPSHGRFLKLRCAILDGTRVGVDGPLFRVMWGQGIDEDKDKVEYPYDPFSNSAPLTGSGGDPNNDDEVDDVVVAIPTSAGYQPPSSQVAPAVDMRVKTRFDKDKYYYGTITAVTEKEVDTTTKGKKQTKSNGGNKKKVDLEISIKYDDGSVEVSSFPDPDIGLVMPGAYFIL